MGLSFLIGKEADTEQIWDVGAQWDGVCWGIIPDKGLRKGLSWEVTVGLHGRKDAAHGLHKH